ncbi:uncharacterized protein LOC117649114 [Thrips palmi]|uniref:Uncharacterized protein LOC117649114 n=1 Tax=Thrips palmi TaxID=161013 RepID=A0A6P8Z9W3_THRPL|nr:uncharacterized protein LOC117649114 [Thrips palmi]
MFAMNAVRRAAAVAIRSDGSRRGVAAYTDIVGTPPTVRISFSEKVGHGVLLFFGIMGYPIYSMLEMAKIRSEEYAQLEIPEEWQAWKERQQK